MPSLVVVTEGRRLLGQSVGVGGLGCWRSDASRKLTVRSDWEVAKVGGDNKDSLGEGIITK